MGSSLTVATDRRVVANLHDIVGDEMTLIFGET
jgi:hypothetical protein